jgi:ArsR family transcriptional regulator, arsenate/arsenite/antimonite-responsive transcriptional repressor
MTKTLMVLGQCAPAPGAGPMARSKASEISGLLKAVADPTRLQILALIAQTEAKEACVCDLTEPLGLSQPTVSHHIKKLSEVGLVNRERRGTWVWYSLNRERWNEIAELFK